MEKNKVTLDQLYSNKVDQFKQKEQNNIDKYNAKIEEYVTKIGETKDDNMILNYEERISKLE